MIHETAGSDPADRRDSCGHLRHYHGHQAETLRAYAVCYVRAFFALMRPYETRRDWLRALSWISMPLRRTEKPVTCDGR
jgi:hypothetical protein